MVEKEAMEGFGNGLPLFSIRLMDSYPQNYILGTILILDIMLISLTFFVHTRYSMDFFDGKHQVVASVLR
jgi:hypothetical protein